MTIEQRLKRLEKHTKRLTAAQTLMAVAMCALVTVAATGENDGRFDAVTARTIWVENDAGDTVVFLGANRVGDGVVSTRSAMGKTLVMLNSAPSHNGTVQTFQPNGKVLVDLSAGDKGGVVNVYNKTGEAIAKMHADENGNGSIAEFDQVTARGIWVENNAGDTVVALLANNLGNGVVGTRTAEGKQLVMLNSEGDMGGVYTYQPNGKTLVSMKASDDGGLINVYNKTGESIATMYADDYGNGVVGAYNRKGRGRTLAPGP